MNHRTLVLNQGYQPLDAVCWQDAFCLIFRDKAEVVTEYTGIVVRSASDEFAVPAVLRLFEYSKPAPNHTKFCRENVFLRDEHTCQYCGYKGPARALTFDHVHPRSKGGPTSWTNIVTACRPCNSRKADCTLRESGMKLRSAPIVPSRHQVQHTLFSRGGHLPPEWEMWIR